MFTTENPLQNNPFPITVAAEVYIYACICNGINNCLAVDFPEDKVRELKFDILVHVLCKFRAVECDIGN